MALYSNGIWKHPKEDIYGVRLACRSIFSVNLLAVELIPTSAWVNYALSYPRRRESVL